MILEDPISDISMKQDDFIIHELLMDLPCFLEILLFNLLFFLPKKNMMTDGGRESSKSF